MTDAYIRTFSSIGSPDFPAEKILGSKDAALVENNGQYLLFYNEKMKKERIRFSVIHENGHYHLNHDMAIIEAKRRDNDSASETMYAKYELEANFFAAQLLMPEQILIELSRRGKLITKEFLQSTFNVSEEATCKRIQCLRKVYNWKTFKSGLDELNLDDCILLKYKSFIDKISPRKMSYLEEYEQEFSLERERQSWL